MRTNCQVPPEFYGVPTLALVKLRSITNHLHGGVRTTLGPLLVIATRSAYCSCFEQPTHRAGHDGLNIKVITRRAAQDA